MKDLKAEAKLKMLQEMKKMATDMMGGELKGKMDGMKKVTVAAPDEESLKKGLEKAKEVVQHDPMDATEDADMDDDADEATEHDMMPDHEAEMSPEEMAQKIKDLQAQLEMLKK